MESAGIRVDFPAGIRVDSGQMRLRPHRQEAGSGAGGEGPQEARGSAEPAVGREGRAHGRQEARGNGEGKAHRKVYAGGEKQEAGRCGCGRKAMHTWPNIPGHWLT